MQLNTLLSEETMEEKYIRTSKIDDGVDERRLLWAAVHQVGVCYLDRSASSVIRRDGLCALGRLLSIGGRESFRLRK